MTVMCHPPHCDIVTESVMTVPRPRPGYDCQPFNLRLVFQLFVGIVGTLSELIVKNPILVISSCCSILKFGVFQFPYNDNIRLIGPVVSRVILREIPVT